MKYEITKKKRRIPASHTPTPWTCGDPFTFDASEFENRRAANDDGAKAVAEIREA